MVTHYHEDHIEDVAYLLAETSRASIRHAPYRSSLIEGKLRSNGVTGKAELHTMRPDEEVVLGLSASHLSTSIIPFPTRSG